METGNGVEKRKRRRKRGTQECLDERLEDVAQKIIAAAVIKAELEDRKWHIMTRIYITYLKIGIEF